MRHWLCCTCSRHRVGLSHCERLAQGDGSPHVIICEWLVPMNNFLLPDGYGQILQGLREHSLSIVVPMYNEAENVEPLLDRMHSALGAYPWPWEVLFVDDGSMDNTASELARCAQKFGPHVRVIELVRNFKQTAAIQAGLDAARGSAIVTR